MEIDPTSITKVLPLAAAAFLLLYGIREKQEWDLLVLSSAVVLVFGTAVFFTIVSQDDLCADEPELALNEVCTTGAECDGNEDFIEIYNLGDHEARLSCFGISNLVGKDGRSESHIVSLPMNAILRGGHFYAMDATKFQYNLSKYKVEHIRLYRLSIDRNLRTDHIMVDDIRTVDNCRIYRSGDGVGEWTPVPNDDPSCEGNDIGTFQRTNT